MLEIFSSLGIGALAAAILYGCYRAVEWRWPERYIGMHETFGLSTTETWLRFLAYRALPYYLIVATTCVTVERLEGHPLLAAAVIWLLGVLLTHGRVIVQSLLHRRGEVNYAGYHLQMIGLLTLVIVGALLSVNWWAVIVPPPEEFLSAIWSALLVAGLGGFVLVTLKPRSHGSPWYGAPYFIERATRDVGIELLDWLFVECRRTGADPVMLKSILVVEVVQRPKWLRRIERLGVRLGAAKTSGAMQMTSQKPLSDKASVTLAAEKYAGVWSLAERAGFANGWEPDMGKSWPVVSRHNSDMSFIEAVGQVAYMLVVALPEDRTHASARAGIILELRRYPKTFALRGVSRCPKVIAIVTGGVGSPRNRSEITSDRGDWWAWEIDIAPTTESLLLVEVEANSLAQVRLVNGEIDRIDWFRATELLEVTPDSETPAPKTAVDQLKAPPRKPGRRVLGSRAPGRRSNRHLRPRKS